MKAMILAGGMSTRLYPLTKEVPKPLVPVAGVPNAVHLIRYLASYGFTEIAINVHYLAGMIREELGDGSKFGVRLHYSYEPVLLGSAGGVKAVEHFLSGGEPFVVVGCDDLTDLPLRDLLAFHERAGAVATIGLVERELVDQYGVVVTERDGRIVGFQEKPPKGTERSHLVNTGIYVFSPEIFASIPPREFYDFGKEVFPALQESGAAFYGFDARSAYWVDIGTPGEYVRASRDVLRGTFAIPHTRASGADPSARIDATARVQGEVWIGAGAIIEGGAEITGPSVIGAGVHVESGARVQASIIWAESHLGAGSLLRETIVGRRYRVAPGEQLVERVVANDPEPVSP